MSLRKYKKHVRLERAARLKQEDISEADEECLRLHMLVNLPIQSFRVGKPPSKEAMVERGKRLVNEHRDSMLDGEKTVGHDAQIIEITEDAQRIIKAAWQYPEAETEA